jgi:hypothetical protein
MLREMVAANLGKSLTVCGQARVLCRQKPPARSMPKERQRQKL